MTQRVDVEVLQGEDAACDAFVERFPGSKVCHCYAWSRRVVAKAGLRPLYLVAREAGEIRGVLPLAHVRSFLFGNRMVSQAFSNYGGPLAESPEAAVALCDRAVELAVENGCDSIEFRNVDPLEYDLHLRTDKMCMHLPLSSDAEDLWRGFKPKVRNLVRKAERGGLTCRSGGAELLKEFYNVYTVRMHQLGSPARSRQSIGNVLTGFPEDSRIFLVHKADKTVGAALTFCWNRFAEIPLAATRVEYNRLCPNMLLYWEVMKYYCGAGASRFDFGRCSVDSSTHRFKKQWGALPVPLNYQYWTRPGRSPTLAIPQADKYRKRVELWKKLPLCVTRILGPRISRNLP